jgi:pyruvate kinase
VNLSFCNREEDLFLARSFLDSVGMQYTKIVAKVSAESRASDGWAHA